METKTCEICGKTLPLSAFSKSYKGRCKECVARLTKEKRSDCLGKKFEYQSLEGSAREAVRYANVLIEELKKYDNG